MKKSIPTIFFLILLISFEVTAQGVWQQKNIGESNCKTIRDIDAVDNNNIIAVGGNTSSGFFLRSSDGGDTWTESPTPNSLNMYKIQFLDTQNVVAAGQGLIRSSDGGNTWEVIFNNIYFQDLYFVSATKGYASRNSNQIYVTEDGGYTWQPKSTGFTNSIFAIAAATDNSVFTSVRETGASGQQFGGIRRSNNSGDFWNSSVITSERIFDLHFPTEQVGYGIGNNGIFVSTQNGGITWQEDFSSFPTERLQAVYFLDQWTGFVIATSGSVFKTSDGGQNWETIYTSSAQNYFFSAFNIFAFDTNRIFSVGNEGVINVTSNGGQDWNIKKTGDVSICRNLEAVFVVDQDNIIIAGNKSAAYYSEDGGDTWEEAVTPSGFISATFYDAFCTDSSNCFLTSSAGLLFSNDKGKNWGTTNMNNVGSIFAIQFPENNSSVGYSVLASGGVYKTTDGGQNWAQKTFPTSDCLLGVHFLDENYGWVAGASGLVAKTTDGGNSWDTTHISFTTPFGQRFFDFNDVHFVNNNVGFLGGDYQTLLKTQDAGQTWDSIAPFNVNDIHFIDEQNGWVVGWYGSIHRTENGGDTWIDESLPNLNKTLKAVHIKDSSTGFIAGNETILQQNFGVDYCIDDQLGICGNFISIPVRANNFTAIDNFQLEIRSTDTSILKIVDTTNVVLPGIMDVEAHANSLKVVWISGNDCTLDYPDGTPIFYIRVELVGPPSSCAELVFDGGLLSPITYQCSSGGNLEIPTITKSAEICLVNNLSLCGVITNANGNGAMEDVEVQVETVLFTQGIDTDFTNSIGAYQLSVLSGSHGIVTPYHDIEWGKNINSNDLSFLVGYLNGVSPWTAAWQVVGADINNDDLINDTDMGALINLIFAPDQPIPNNTSWRFISEAFYPFPLTQSPQVPYFEEHFTFFNIAADNCSIDFSGIKVGDLDGNADFNSNQNDFNSNPVFSIFSKIEKTETPNHWAISFYQNELAPMTSMQLALEFDVAKFDFIGLEKNNLNKIFLDQSSIADGIIQLIGLQQTDFSATTLRSDSDALFTILLKSKNSNNIFPKINLTTKSRMPSLVFSHHNQLMPQLSQYEEATSAKLFCFPNPWSHQTTVEVFVPENSPNGMLLIRDATGRMVKQFDVSTKQNFYLEKNQFPAGLYFLELILDGKAQAIQKMIVTN